MEGSVSDYLWPFGGVQVALTALVAFLGRIWLNRIHERDRQAVEAQLERLRGELAATNQKLQAALQKSVLVHKVQFETEFDAYRNVWAQLIEVANATLALRPMMDYLPNDDAGRRENKENRIRGFNEANVGFARETHRNRPFFAEEIFKELVDLLKLVRTEAAEYAYQEGRGDAEYWRNAKTNADEILRRIDQVCESIRSRISRMTVID